MLTEVKVNESPNHFMALDAKSGGINSIDKIAKVTKLHKSEVELILNDLFNLRLINMTEKRGFFGNKKVRRSITETGVSFLMQRNRN